MLRLIHSGDLHLGKRFGNFSGDLPGRLREARHQALGRLAEQARAHGATTILLAGDTFDTETPAPEIRRQALAEMRDHAPLRWVILPGNHDSLQAAQLWETLRAEAPDNVILATEQAPILLPEGAAVLPAPCTTRRPGRDLTDWMGGAATAEGTIRIGLAHGAVRSFSEESVAADVIAPDRARLAGLDYLALGDWHGPVAVDARTRYSGTPEPDRFKHDRDGEALLITIAAAGAPPEATPVPTGRFAWRVLPLHLLDCDDPTAALAVLLPEARLRRQTLARIVATGRSRLAGRSALSAAIADATPDFAHLECDESGLGTECDAADLDAIDRGGALREAANALLAEAEDETLAATDREIARAALARLHALSETVGP